MNPKQISGGCVCVFLAKRHLAHLCLGHLGRQRDHSTKFCMQPLPASSEPFLRHSRKMEAKLAMNGYEEEEKWLLTKPSAVIPF